MRSFVTPPSDTPSPKIAIAHVCPTLYLTVTLTMGQISAMVVSGGGVRGGGKCQVTRHAAVVSLSLRGSLASRRHICAVPSVHPPSAEPVLARHTRRFTPELPECSETKMNGASGHRRALLFHRRTRQVRRRLDVLLCRNSQPPSTAGLQVL